MEKDVLLRLFVAGKTPRSMEAIESVEKAFDAQFSGEGSLEIIDVLQQPDVADEAQVLVTPTLIRQVPKPVRRLIGDFSDGQKVFKMLEMDGEAS